MGGAKQHADIINNKLVHFSQSDSSDNAEFLCDPLNAILNVEFIVVFVVMLLEKFNSSKLAQVYGPLNTGGVQDIIQDN